MNLLPLKILFGAEQATCYEISKGRSLFNTLAFPFETLS